MLTIDALNEIVKRAGAAAGVRRLHCHLLRHTFATNYLCREVGDPLRLQQILGHTSLEMVRRYVAAANVNEASSSVGARRWTSFWARSSHDRRPAVSSRSDREVCGW